MSTQSQSVQNLDLHAQIRSELERGAVDVPLLPDVASEVLSTSVDEHSNAVKMANLIEKDQGLASHILRVSNSPVFRGSSECVSLQQAIARLGMERLREIAMTISIKGALVVDARYAEPVERAWSMGLGTGLWSKEVARSARKNVEVAYLCGLLHNVGVPVVVGRATELDKDVSMETLQALIDELHPLAGALLVDKWHLPDVIGQCIASLHGEQVDARLASEKDALNVLQAGIVLSRAQAEGEMNTETLLEQTVFQELNFYPDDLETLLTHADRVEETVRGLA